MTGRCDVIGSTAAIGPFVVTRSVDCANRPGEEIHRRKPTCSCSGVDGRCIAATAVVVGRWNSGAPVMLTARKQTGRKVAGVVTVGREVRGKTASGDCRQWRNIRLRTDEMLVQFDLGRKIRVSVLLLLLQEAGSEVSPPHQLVRQRCDRRQRETRRSQSESRVSPENVIIVVWYNAVDVT